MMFILNWTALSLTDSRTAQIGAAAGIGITAGILILQYMKRNGREPRFILPVTVSGMLFTAVVCIGLSLGMVFAFNAAKTAKGELLPAAGAEESQEEIRIHVWPQSAKAGLDEKITLNANAEGMKGDVRYQWQYYTGGKWFDLKSTASKKPVFRMTVRDSTYWRRYRCVVTAENGSAASEEIRILKPYAVTLAVRSTKSAVGERLTIIA